MVDRQIPLLPRVQRGASVLLLGPRGVGKTALVRAMLPGLGPSLQVDLLDPALYQRYLRSPEQLLVDVRGSIPTDSEQNLLVFIDEIQKVPALLDVVHLLYEELRPRIQFVLTGSSARKLKRGGANLLAGRLLGMRLHPLTATEYPLPWEKVLTMGSLPGIVIDNPEPEATLRSYVHMYLKEEVLEEALVRKVDAFSRFLELAGQYHGEPLNASNLGRSAGLSARTVLD